MHAGCIQMPLRLSTAPSGIDILPPKQFRYAPPVAMDLPIHDLESQAPKEGAVFTKNPFTRSDTDFPRTMPDHVSQRQACERGSNASSPGGVDYRNMTELRPDTELCNGQSLNFPPPPGNKNPPPTGSDALLQPRKPIEYSGIALPEV